MCQSRHKDTELQVGESSCAGHNPQAPASCKFVGCTHKPTCITPNAGSLQGSCIRAPWESNCLMALRGCLVTCPLHRLWLVKGQALGGPGEGRAYTHHLPCVPGAGRPCNDAEFLLALCTSDFGERTTPSGGRGGSLGPPLPYMPATDQCLPAAIHGTIRGVAHDTELQESVITVAAARVLQTLPLFQVEGSGGQVQASIRTPPSCGVRLGPGTFLFMGWSRFGEAWLGCASRIQEFSRAFAAAHANHLYPCEVTLD